MPSFYTRKGDDGTTGLLGEGRILKSDLRMETIGSLDEACAQLGMARSLTGNDRYCEMIVHLQRDLYRIMTEIAAVGKAADKFPKTGQAELDWLEHETDQLSEQIHLPGGFILPGDNSLAAAMDVARAVVRRAERRIVELHQNEPFSNDLILRYMNRLSSICFLLEIAFIEEDGGSKPTLAKTKDRA
jgi:cob(I)alamin adenosyltransferase